MLDWPAVQWRATILGLVAGAAVGALVGLAFGLMGLVVGVFYGSPVGLVCGIVAGVLLNVLRRTLTSVARARLTGALVGVVIAVVFWVSILMWWVDDTDDVGTNDVLYGLVAVVVFGAVGAFATPWAVSGPPDSRLAASRHGSRPGAAWPVQESDT